MLALDCMADVRRIPKMGTHDNRRCCDVVTSMNTVIVFVLCFIVKSIVCGDAIRMREQLVTRDLVLLSLGLL
jgi:hypothetical protein